MSEPIWQCAWCRQLFGPGGGLLDPQPPLGLVVIVGHGACDTCGALLMHEARTGRPSRMIRAQVAAARRAPQPANYAAGIDASVPTGDREL